MGIMDTLNNLTNQLNNAADKITNSGNDYNGASAQGIGGLGNINKDNANGQLESPGGFITKIDKDSRKLATYMEQFIDSEKYVNYIDKWFKSCGINSEVVGSLIKISIPTQYGNTANYTVFACRNQAEADNALGYLTQGGASNTSVANILIGYINYSMQEISTANTCNTQLIGISEINEINHAVDLATKRLPYVAVNKAKFVSILSKHVHTFYSNQVGGVNAQATFNNAASGIESSLNNFGNRVQSAANGFAAGMGLASNQDQNVNQQYQQQPIQQQPVEQPQQFNEQQAQHVGVSLSKENNQTDNVNKTDESIKVSLDKN